MNNTEAAKAARSHLTVVEMVYHQPIGDKPTVAESRYTRVLEDGEAPYIGQLKVSQEWMPIETGWIVSASGIVIENVAERFLVQPTEEERKA